MSEIRVQGRAIGGKAAAAKMTPEQRKARAMKAVEAKKSLAGLPKATHDSKDRPLNLGGCEIPCYVLEDGSRVLSQRGLARAMGFSEGGDRLGSFLGSKGLKPFVNKKLLPALNSPIRFINPSGGGAAHGYHATLLPDICDVILEARKRGNLNETQLQIADQCEILVRGFARVGIIALVDEATGYQRDRARDALAKILEAYVAKELQPYVRTFDAAYYEQMFRLRGIPFPPEKAHYRPGYFGHLTNDVVYSRLAPGVPEALKEEAKKIQKSTKLFQHLTAGCGRQELLKHLGMIVGLMKISSNWQDFMQKINKIAPRYGETIPLELEEKDR